MSSVRDTLHASYGACTVFQYRLASLQDVNFDDVDFTMKSIRNVSYFLSIKHGSERLPSIRPSEVKEFEQQVQDLVTVVDPQNLSLEKGCETDQVVRDAIFDFTNMALTRTNIVEEESVPRVRIPGQFAIAQDHPGSFGEATWSTRGQDWERERKRKASEYLKLARANLRSVMDRNLPSPPPAFR
ncbi:MAG: hypothetical protein Q9190_003890 [Brigantiaea leucoxantha]